MPRLAIGCRLSSILMLLASGTAAAQPAGDLQLDPFRPAIDSRGYLTINASQTLGHKEVSFGLGSLSWGHKLLSFEGDAGAQYIVSNVVTATLIAAVGLKLGPADLQFGASVPLTIVNGDRGPDSLGGPGPNDDVNFKLDGQGVGNIGLHLKTRFVKTSRPPHVGVGVIASLYLPTATSGRFMGEKQLTPQLMGILDKELGYSGRLRVALNGGIRCGARPRSRIPATWVRRRRIARSPRRASCRSAWASPTRSRRASSISSVKCSERCRSANTRATSRSRPSPV